MKLSSAKSTPAVVRKGMKKMKTAAKGEVKKKNNPGNVSKDIVIRRVNKLLQEDKKVPKGAHWNRHTLPQGVYDEAKELYIDQGTHVGRANEKLALTETWKAAKTKLARQFRTNYLHTLPRRFSFAY